MVKELSSFLLGGIHSYAESTCLKLNGGKELSLLFKSPEILILQLSPLQCVHICMCVHVSMCVHACVLPCRCMCVCFCVSCVRVWCACVYMYVYLSVSVCVPLPPCFRQWWGMNHESMKRETGFNQGHLYRLTRGLRLLRRDRHI